MIEIYEGKENDLIIPSLDLRVLMARRSSSNVLHKLLKKDIIDITSGNIDTYSVKNIEDINLLFNYYLGLIFNMYLTNEDLTTKILDIEMPESYELYLSILENLKNPYLKFGSMCFEVYSTDNNRLLITYLGKDFKPKDDSFRIDITKDR